MEVTGKSVLADPRPHTDIVDVVGASILIAIPFYRGEDLVGRLVQSLLRCAADIRALGAHVVLYNDSPDYPALSEALETARASIGDAFSVEIRTNHNNLGWLKTANLAMTEAMDRGVDIILLNSDTVVFPGAFSEMVRVSRIDPMIGFVNPRSNNATLASLPIGERFRAMGPVEAEAAWRQTASTLSELTYTPTAVGFAMLIRSNILVEFGLFDEVYGGGYNEENDLVMRASRCGYRSVLANRAFVWHEGEKSFGQGAAAKHLVETTNRAILDARYPEYSRLIEEWFAGSEHRAELLLSTLVPGPDGRLDIAFDFSNFGSYHSGTQKAALQILRCTVAWKDRFAIFVLCDPETYAFHEIDDIGVERRDPHGPELFAAIFRIGQPFEWGDLLRLTLKGATLGFFMLDTIAEDCSHLRSTRVFHLWQHVINHANFIVYNSHFTRQQFERRFTHAGRAREVVSLHSLDLADYLSPADGPVSPDVEKLADGFTFVFGNQYPHKAVGETANRLAAAYPDQRVVALGITKERSSQSGAPPGEASPLRPRDNCLLLAPNLEGFRAGQLSDADMDALQRKAGVIIMPSHYEGFGLPIPAAMAYRKPMIVRDIPALREVHAGLGGGPNVHFFSSTQELVGLMRKPPRWIDTPEPIGVAGDAERAADDIRRLIDEAIGRATYTSIFDRFASLHMLFGASHVVVHRPAEPEVLDNNADAAARRMAVIIERIMRRLFHVPAFYATVQVFYRAYRWIRNAGRSS